MYPRMCPRAISSISSQTTVDGSPTAGVVFLMAVIPFLGMVPGLTTGRPFTARFFSTPHEAISTGSASKSTGTTMAALRVGLPRTSAWGQTDPMKPHNPSVDRPPSAS